MAVKYFFESARPNGIHGGTRKNPDTKGVDVEVGGYFIPVADFLAFSEKVAKDPDVAQAMKKEK